MIATTTKRCSRCKTDKDRASFNSDASKPDGLFRWCRDCSREAKRLAYLARPAHFKAQVKRWREANLAEAQANARAGYRRNREQKIAAARKYRTRNRAVIRTRARAYYSRNRNLISERYAAARVGISRAEYSAILAASGGVCAICAQAPTTGRGRRLHIDHDHKTGAVRGMLCHLCNIGLGHFREQTALLRSAVDYLRAHGVE